MALADTRFATRRRALAAKLAAQRIDSILVTSPIHVRYLSGFTGSNGALIVNKDLSAQICTDGRYTTQIAEEVPDIEALIERASATTLLAQVEGPRRIAIEAAQTTLDQLDSLREATQEDVELIPVSGVVESIRLTKDSFELDRLRDVAALASQAFEDLLAAGELAEGRSERQVAADLEYRMRLLGAERPSFDTIVASGPNSAKPHHGAGDRILQRGDLVTIDFGAHARGFNSDMTRTLVMGEAGSSKQKSTTSSCAPNSLVLKQPTQAPTSSTSTQHAAKSSKTQATANTSCTPPATASDLKSTKPQAHPKPHKES